MNQFASPPADEEPIYKRYRKSTNTIMGMALGAFVLWAYLLMEEHLQLLHQPFVAPRSEWVCKRTSDFYADMQECWPSYAADTETRHYIQKFRVCKQTFNAIFMMVGSEPEFRKLDTNFRKCVPPRKRFAITMNWLAKSPMFSELGQHWGLGQTTVTEIVHECVTAMDRVLSPRSIVFPATTAALLSTIQGFKDLYNLPQCAGAIDGSFISMLRPPGEFGFRYWSYKHNDYAVLLLAVVDSTGMFTYVHVGKPATVGDSATFHQSALKEGIEQGGLLPVSLSVDVGGDGVHPEGLQVQPVVRPRVVPDGGDGV
jgi:hypothetical protein